MRCGGMTNAFLSVDLIQTYFLLQFRLRLVETKLAPQRRTSLLHKLPYMGIVTRCFVKIRPLKSELGDDARNDTGNKTLSSVFWEDVEAVPVNLQYIAWISSVILLYRECRSMLTLYNNTQFVMVIRSTRYLQQLKSHVTRCHYKIR